MNAIFKKFKGHSKWIWQTFIWPEQQSWVNISSDNHCSKNILCLAIFVVICWYSSRDLIANRPHIKLKAGPRFADTWWAVVCPPLFLQNNFLTRLPVYPKNYLSFFSFLLNHSWTKAHIAINTNSLFCKQNGWTSPGFMLVQLVLASISVIDLKGTHKNSLQKR